MPKTFSSDTERRAYYAAAMARSRAANPERQRVRNAVDGRTYRGRYPTLPKPFVGVDGEGGNYGPLDHRYFLLRAGDLSIENTSGLESWEALDFLATLPLGREYVAYYFDYDVTMMLRGLGDARLTRLLDRETRQTAKDGTRLWHCLPIDIEGRWQIDYLPRKFLKVRRRGEDWRTISDVGSFFQCSFVKALRRWDVGNEAIWTRIESMKFDRENFTHITDEIRAYNQEEVDLLADLMERFRTVCQDVSYVPTKWQGPGYLAVSMFKRNSLPKAKEYLRGLPVPLLEGARAAYYGGRFETASVGPVPGPVYQYDINSAYPWALTKLPCLLHGYWLNFDVESDFKLKRIRFEPRAASYEGVAFYAFPVRDKTGAIAFPRNGTGWYWSCEIDAAIHQKVTKTYETWSYVKQCDCQPFNWVPDIYQERIELGKAARGLVLKLGLNSLYGKTVQSIGRPAYAQPVWGSLITALVRAKLYSAVHAAGCTPGVCGGDVHMLATDAVFSTVPIDLSIGKALGDWDLETHDSLFVIQPGVYLMGGNKAPKTRGIPQRNLMDKAQEFRDVFDAGGWDTAVPVPLHVFIGMRAALHWRKPELMGQWIDVYKEVTFAWQSKRRGRGPDERGLFKDKAGVFRTDPIESDPTRESVPYDKDIGQAINDARFLTWEQPEGSDTFVLDEN